jgi:DNA-binding transcriptional LysR family regulator
MGTDRWHSLEVRHLVAFRTIAEEGSFAAAALRLGYTQSAISQQIAALERIVGASVLVRPRGRKPVGVTPAGELLLRHCGTILARLHAARADLAAISEGDLRLRVGTYQSIGIRVLSEFLPRFRSDWEAVEVLLQESISDDELLDAVEHGMLDLAFCTIPARDGPFEVTELLRDPYYLVAPRDSPVARQGFHPEVTRSLTIVAYRTCPIEPDVETVLRSRGIEPLIVSRSDDNATLQAFVAAGVGVAFMPRLSVDEDDTRVSLVEIDGLLPPRLLVAVSNRNRERSAAVQAFVAAAKAVADSLAVSPGPRRGRAASRR